MFNYVLLYGLIFEVTVVSLLYVRACYRITMWITCYYVFEGFSEDIVTKIYLLTMDSLLWLLV